MGAEGVTAAWFEKSPDSLSKLETMLRTRFPNLHAFIEDGECRVRGTYALQHGEQEFDRYQLEIALPKDYPARPLRVRETGGRIPLRPDRHVFLDGALCLGAPLALWVDLGGDFSLERMLDIPIRNFLIGNSLVEQGEPWPHDERSHGALGLVEHLRELLGTQRPMMVATFLQAVAAGGVSKHSRCPCASGRKILKCHHEGFKALRRIPPGVLNQTASMILKECEPEQ